MHAQSGKTCNWGTILTGDGNYCFLQCTPRIMLLFHTTIYCMFSFLLCSYEYGMCIAAHFIHIRVKMQVRAVKSLWGIVTVSLSTIQCKKWPCQGWNYHACLAACNASLGNARSQNYTFLTGGTSTVGKNLLIQSIRFLVRGISLVVISYLL